MILSTDELTELAEETLARLDVPADWAMALEGSIAEGFGNPSSDVDFLLVAEDSADDSAELPTMPSLLFVAGRRVEVRTRSVGQLLAQFAEVRAARRVGDVPEDLLNRCQRFLGAHPVRGGDLLARVRSAMPPAELAAVLVRWWAHHARQCARQAVAAELLGRTEEAAGWASAALTQAVKSWAAALGETYLEPKWLSLQLERIGEEAVAARYWELAAGDRLAEVLAFVERLGVDGCRHTPDAVLLASAPRVTTWQIGDRLHVVRERRDVFVLGDAAGRVWRSLVAGRPVAELLTAREPRAGDVLAALLRFGLVRLRWRGGGIITPALPLAAPAGPSTPPPGTARPPVRLSGATPGDDHGVDLVPLPADRFGAAAMGLVWSNVLIENVREDLAGALARGQWRVAELSARRVVLVCARALLSAHGVVPLPPDSEVTNALALLPDTGEARALADRHAALRIESTVDAEAVLPELDRLVALTRGLTGAEAFPSSFGSARDWDDTLAIGYDWLRLGAYLDADLPIDEARDLLASGGGQPGVS